VGWIKHKKAIVDAKRGQAFTKVAAELSVAAREAGTTRSETSAPPRHPEGARGQHARTTSSGDPAGAGGKDGVKLEEVRYEGYGPTAWP